MNQRMHASNNRARRWRLIVLAVIVLLVALGVALALRFGDRAVPVLDT